MQDPADKETDWAEASSTTSDDESDGDASSADTIPISIPSKFLLSESSSSLNEDLPPVGVGVDPETHARLEAILNATGLSKFSLEAKQFNDPEVLRRLTTSVSSALDEAAAALTQMRAERAAVAHQPPAGAASGLQQVAAGGPPGSCAVGSALTASSAANSSAALQGQQPDSPQQQQQAGPGGSPSSSTSSPCRSLVDACMDGDITTVKRLLDTGRDVNQITEEGESLLSLACASGYFELAQLLLVMRANLEERGLKDTTPLMEAANAGYCDIVKLLLTHGADVNARTQQGNTALMFACSNGFEDVVQVLLQAGGNAEAHNENGHTPLMEAASAGQVAVARLLVKHGAQINSHSNEFKESALTLACYKGHLEMVRFLLEAGADREHKTDEMHTALMEASMDGHVEVARLLLDSGAQVNMPQDSFESPLTLAACGGHVELAQLLLDRGANIEEVNDEGYTPLMEAAREGHEEMVALLLSQGADINAQTEETQETALTLACCGGFLEVTDFLIKAGADLELGASTPLMEAAQEGHVDLVRYLIGAGANVNACTATGDTALTYACENGHTDVADLLLQAGAAMEHESEGGRTPLMKAARAGNVCTVKFLLAKGAEPNKRTTTNDHTPLSLACTGGHLQVARMLLDAGANPAHRLKDNSSMLIEAAKGGHLDTVRLLLDYRKDCPFGLAPLPVPPVTAAIPPAGTIPGSVQGVAQGVPAPAAGKTCIHKIQDKKDSNLLTSPAGGVPADVEMDPSNVPTALNPAAVVGDARPMNLSEFRACLSSIMVNGPVTPLQAAAVALAGSTGSTKEDKLRSQQQVLEELQKVERELQEKVQQSCKTDARGFLTSLVNNAVNETAHFVSHPEALPTPPAGVASAAGVAPGADAVVSADEAAQAVQVTPGGLMVAAPPRALQQELVEGQEAPAGCAVLPGPPATGEVLPTGSLSLLDVEWQTDSNHDTALTLACSGGYKELVGLLIARGANIEHRDKKCFTPLMLAATAGHSAVVEALLEHGAQTEAQSERTKDTALSLACSGGRLEVVEMLLGHGANREHRNVSDYTPLSLAASGGYVNIIRLLLHHGAEINSRTGSKLGISPLMLAAMNGHAAAVRLLLDQGSDINAQIETNRNTALTLACFQGRHEVVSLLLDRKANVEHRAKTGLTPLMEAASGGYVDVGRVLLDKGADVNAPPVPTSRDTALTIAADKGHLRFVELLLERNAAVDVRNKKGNSPLWLACNGGHLDVVQRLVAARADIDSQDNRKVSCLMAAFRKGHHKVVKWMVRNVMQFPSDQEMTRYIQTISDKELLKKCESCAHSIHQAKERQAAEANRNASSLLKALEEEKTREEQKKAAAARRREKKRLKKKAKQVSASGKEDEDDDDADAELTDVSGYQPTETRAPTIDEISRAGGSPTCIVPQRKSNHGSPPPVPKAVSPPPVLRVEMSPSPSISPPLQSACTNHINPGPAANSTLMTSSTTPSFNRKDRKKNSERNRAEPLSTQPSNNSVALGAVLVLKNLRLNESNQAGQHSSHSVNSHPPSKEEQPFEAVTTSRQRNKASSKLQQLSGGIREEGWKEVTRRTKKVTVPAAAISRVIGRAGCNINAIREISGAHIEVEKQNPKANQGERTVLIRGSAEATKHAQNLIAGLAENADAELSDVLQRCGLAGVAARTKASKGSATGCKLSSQPTAFTTQSGANKTKMLVQPAPPPAQPAWSTPGNNPVLNSKAQSPQSSSGSSMTSTIATSAAPTPATTSTRQLTSTETRSTTSKKASSLPDQSTNSKTAQVLSQLIASVGGNNSCNVNAVPVGNSSATSTARESPVKVLKAPSPVPTTATPELARPASAGLSTSPTIQMSSRSWQQNQQPPGGAWGGGDSASAPVKGWTPGNGPQAAGDRASYFGGCVGLGVTTPSLAVGSVQSPPASPRAASSASSSLSPRSEEETCSNGKIHEKQQIVSSVGQPPQRASSASASVISINSLVKSSNSLNNNVSTVNASLSAHGSPTNFRTTAGQTHVVAAAGGVGGASSAPTTPPFGLSAGSRDHSPTPVGLIGSSTGGNAVAPPVGTSALDFTSVPQSAINPVGSMSSSAAVGSFVNGGPLAGPTAVGSDNNMAMTPPTRPHVSTLLDLQDPPAPLISAQVPNPVGTGSGYKFSQHHQGHGAAAGHHSIDSMSLYSNNNNNSNPTGHYHQQGVGSHLGPLNSHLQAPVYHGGMHLGHHQEMNGHHQLASGHGGLPSHLQQQQSVGGALQQHHHHIDRQMPPLPIGTERAQQRKTSAMPGVSNPAHQMWNTMNQPIALTDTERHWGPHYNTNAIDHLTPMAGGSEAYLLRSLTGHGNHGAMAAHHGGHPSLPDSILGTLAATPGVPLTDLYAANTQNVASALQGHQGGHQMAPHPHQSGGLGAASAGVMHANSQHSAVMNGGSLGTINGLMSATGQGAGGYMFGGAGQATDPWAHQQHPQHRSVPSHQVAPQHHLGAHNVHQGAPHPPPGHSTHGHKPNPAFNTGKVPWNWLPGGQQ